MTPRIERLRQESFEAVPSISIERAVLVTRFYKESYGKYSMPVLRALPRRLPDQAQVGLQHGQLRDRGRRQGEARQEAQEVKSGFPFPFT